MELNRIIDHTLLKPDATIAQIEKLCDEAKQYHFASVCVNPSYVSLCAKLLKDSDVNVCTVIGFPLGQSTTKIKCAEALDACNNGAKEIDMVINIAALKNGQLDYVTNEITEVKDVCHRNKAILKVIIETCLLTDSNKIDACKCVSAAHADYIKTSTGFSTGGATVEDVKLMKKHIAPEVKIKASGGIRSRKDAQALVEAGASRLGTSRSVSIVTYDK